MAKRSAEAVSFSANRKCESCVMNSATQLNFDVVVVGAGPAGLAAATTAAQHGRRVALIDDNPRLGGQIWRSGTATSDSPEAKYWLELLAKSKVDVFGGAPVFSAEKSAVDAETDEGLLHIRFQKLVLATGARELYLPFPGWTLPNVMGAGGLQALAKSGLPVSTKRVVLAGTGPLLLAVAAFLADHGAKVVCVCEQASWFQLAPFAFSLLSSVPKAIEGVRLRYKSRGAQYLTGGWIVAASGKGRLEAVSISEGDRVREVECDYLGCGYHLIPNTELAQSIGCRLKDGFVETDEFQETSEQDVYCAGEPTAIGGMELSSLEGRIAGHAVAGAREAAEELFPARSRYQRLAESMRKAFRLRPELAKLATPDTLLCRCEDVSFEKVQQFDSWKSAKLHSRCGMGPCQGRVCGAAAKFLFGWNTDWNRPPVFPVRCSSLAAMSSVTETREFHGGNQ
jgi:NADPH-dependent 2,4-dienoyl-CoA reductase/sulfur reductase-like enzyme